MVYLLMQKNEKLILKVFQSMETPTSFRNGELSYLVDATHGFVQRLLSDGYLEGQDIKDFCLDKELKDVINKTLSSNVDNIIYFNTMKSCFVLFEKYKK